MLRLLTSHSARHMDHRPLTDPAHVPGWNAAWILPLQFCGVNSLQLLRALTVCGHKQSLSLVAIVVFRFPTSSA